MKLVSVYEHPEDSIGVLYDLLSERDETINISHKRMPTYEEHKAFVMSEPYAHWYLVEDAGYVGSIYLTKQNEVGIFIFRDRQGKGFGKWALTMLREKHPGRILANIAPTNCRSIKFFESEGFRLIQHTYELA